MNIKENIIENMSIADFAERHGLVMEIKERPEPLGSPMRFYAHFEHCDVIGDGVLIGTFGDGATKQQAVEDYAKQISLKRIAINALKPQERRLSVPRLNVLARIVQD
jgi:hypothetical protein